MDDAGNAALVQEMTARSILRASLAGIAGGAAWWLGLRLAFGPAQQVLTDPDWQSAKMLAAFGAGPQGPRMYASGWLVPAGLGVIGLLWGWTYVWLARDWIGSWWARGLKFGLTGKRAARAAMNFAATSCARTL
jgi:hypothetical protein